MIERYMLDDDHNGIVSADGGNVVLDFVDPDGNGAQAITMSKRYLYSEAVDQIFAQEDLSKTLGDAARNLWPLVDHLGTVRDLARQDGTIAAHYKYDSFGNVTSGDTSKTRYLFTSREFDTATKLQYNRARYYDAAAGRWISEDPLGFAAGDANVGRYAANSTAIATDSTGQFWHIVIGAIVGAVAGAINGAIHDGDPDSDWGRMDGALTGALAGGVGGAVGAATFGGVIAVGGGSYIVGAGAGTAAGVTGGLAGGLVQETGDAIHGDGFSCSDLRKSVVTNALVGSVTGGVAGGLGGKLGDPITEGLIAGNIQIWGANLQ